METRLGEIEGVATWRIQIANMKNGLARETRTSRMGMQGIRGKAEARTIAVRPIMLTKD